MLKFNISDYSSKITTVSATLFVFAKIGDCTEMEFSKNLYAYVLKAQSNN